MDTVARVDFDCVDRHMPSVTRSALGEGLVGDVAMHLFAINSDPSTAQFFTEDDQDFMSPYPEDNERPNE